LKKRSPFQIFKSVIKALLLREIQTRFGSKKMGYFWMVAEPIFTIVVFALMKQILHPNGMPGISYPVFVASGLIAYYMFKNIINKSIDAFSANKALFVYKQVKPFDTLVARMIVELGITSFILIFMTFIGWYIGLDMECKNILGVIIAYIWLALFAFSLGVFFSVLGFLFENFGKVIKIIFLPMFFLSAIFYTIDSLPPIAQKVLLYNPVVHFMEMIHGNFFYGMDTKYVDYNYNTFMDYYSSIFRIMAL